MLGYGRSSIPGESYTVNDQVEALYHLVKNRVPNDVPLIILGRSWGGKIGLSLGTKLYLEDPKSLRGLILIAPYVDGQDIQNCPPQLKKLVPVLLVWAEDDGLVPFSNSSLLTKEFGCTNFISFGRISQRTHFPEDVKMDAFHNEATKFLETIIKNE